ncbi:uncharacterized protein [Vicugna pacos]|uniref:Uncharacterized protein n=2 Tax=Vicugna pacos TaxID=30538 RepID=A0ABM5CXR2_VICPA
MYAHSDCNFSTLTQRGSLALLRMRSQCQVVRWLGAPYPSRGSGPKASQLRRPLLLVESGKGSVTAKRGSVSPLHVSASAPRSIHLWQLGQKKARKLFPLASTSVALESVEAERKSPALRFEGPPATARGAGVFRVAQQGNQVTEGTVLGILVVRDMGTPLNSEEGQRDSSWKQGFQGDTLPRTGGLCPEQTPGRQCGAVGSSSEKGAETQGDFSTGEPGDHACKDHPHGMAKELVVPRLLMYVWRTRFNDSASLQDNSLKRRTDRAGGDLGFLPGMRWGSQPRSAFSAWMLKDQAHLKF